MELPKGAMNVKTSEEVPKDTALIVQNKKVVGAITNIKCPVVSAYNKRRGRTVERTKPSNTIDNVKYDKDVTLEQVTKQYVLLALEAHGGSICKAAKSLGIGKNTIYRHLGKFYGKQYETK